MKRVLDRAAGVGALGGVVVVGWRLWTEPVLAWTDRLTLSVTLLVVALEVMLVIVLGKRRGVE